MVVDIRPATGAVATLARILWGVAGSSPARATCTQHALCARVESFRHCFFVFVFFLVKRTFINCLLGVIGTSLRGLSG